MTYFDSYLEQYKESEMRPSALYFSGLSHLVGKNYPLANSRMIELQVKHPKAQEIPSSFNVLGDILSAREKSYAEVTDTYKKALAMIFLPNKRYLKPVSACSIYPVLYINNMIYFIRGIPHKLKNDGHC